MTATGSEFRPDIEGLRALAVLAVLLYHADLAGLDGGYIGVDVFFVLSGFLITRLLVGEVERTGTVSLAAFWGRRARRLLPASTLVVVATLIASRFALDPLTQGFVGRSALAASGFGANLLFWTRGGYSQLEIPEPLLHFWSLAVEEQFYLFWPLVIVAIARLTRSRGDVRRATVGTAVLLGGGSLVACILITPDRQPFAFYWLPTRAWELLVGALLAVAPLRLIRSAPFVRAVFAWIGLLLIGICAVAYEDPALGFPGGRAVVPVLATAAVILGGAHAPAGPVGLLSWAPMQWVGKRSYAIYLWHFPILVLAEAEWGPIDAWGRASLLVASVLVAAASFVLLEDPVRRSAWLGARPRRSLSTGAALVGVGMLAAAVVLNLGQSLGTEEVVAAPVLTTAATNSGDSTPSSDAGPADSDSVDSEPVDSGAGSTAPASTAPVSTAPATIPPPSQTNSASLRTLAADNAELIAAAVKATKVPANLDPPLSRAYGDKPRLYTDGCLLDNRQTTAGKCTYGRSSSKRTVVLMGDSHAAQWFPALEQVAKDQGWRLVVLTKKHCPVGEVPQKESFYTRDCQRWRERVYERVAEMKPQVIVMSSIRYKGTTLASSKRGLDVTVGKLKPHADRLILLGDTPTPDGDVPSCVARNLRRLTRCVFDKAGGVNPSRQAADKAVAKKHSIDYVVPNDWLCTRSRCPVVLGNVLLYRDETHLSETAARFLTPYIAAMLEPFSV